MATAQPALTECPVCSEHYTDPKLLPCAHRLCRRCVVSWLRQHPGTGHPTCPLCRRHITTVSAGTSAESVADQLPSDETMTALVKCTEALEGPNDCAGCGQSHASDFCLQCWEKYCPSCSKLHTNMALGRNHTISALSALTPQDLMASRRRMCETHPSNQADIFCANHQVAICVTCSSTSHRKCDDIVEVKSEGGRKRQAVRDKLTELQKVADTYNQTRRALKCQKSRTDIWFEREIQRVTAVRQRLLMALDAGIDKMMTDINRAASREHQEIQSRIDALSDQLGYLGNQMKLLEEEEAMAADCDLVTMGTSLLDRVASLTLDDEVTGDDGSRKYCVAMFDEAHISRLEKELREMGSIHQLPFNELWDKAFPQQEKGRTLSLYPAIKTQTSTGTDTRHSDRSCPNEDVVDSEPDYELKQFPDDKAVGMSVCRRGLASGQTAKSNMKKALTDLSPGPHAMIWLVPVLSDRHSPTVKAKWESLTVDCYQAAKRLLQPFPAHKLIVGFGSYRDESELDVEEYLSRASPDIRSVVQEAGGRWYVVLTDEAKKADELSWCGALTAQNNL